MDQNLPLLSGCHVPRRDVVVLQCADNFQFDSAPLVRLFAEKDDACAEQMVCRALEDIAMRLDQIQQGLEISTFASMVKPARRISLIAAQIGMTEVSVAARHVVTCLTLGDPVGLQATLARMERGFDMAVSEVWNFRDR